MRLELTTYRVKAGYSIQLSYAPISLSTSVDFRFDERFRFVILILRLSQAGRGGWIRTNVLQLQRLPALTACHHSPTVCAMACDHNGLQLSRQHEVSNWKVATSNPDRPQSTFRLPPVSRRGLRTPASYSSCTVPAAGLQSHANPCGGACTSGFGKLAGQQGLEP